VVVKIIPEPVKLETTGKFFDFNGFSNFPEFLSKEFNIPKGTWTIKKVEHKGTGLKICDKTVEIWGNENICYATLIQVIKQTKTKLPELLVEEKFTFKFRGFHLDIARGGVPKVETFKRILRWLFLLKYNYFAIYFEDLFPWEKYPQIGAKRGKLSVEEWREVVEYGKKLGIEVFPSLELAGHMEHILTLPEFRKYSEWHRPSEGCLNVADKEAREFAFSLLEEALEKTESKYIHIGGDETWAMGRGRSLDKTRVYEGPKLYADYHSELIKRVKRKDKIPVMWGDMLLGKSVREEEKELWRSVLKNPIWSEALIANWDYSPSPKEYFREKIRVFKEKGYRQIVCPGFSNWNKYYPDFDVALVNIKNFIEAAKEEKVEGFMVTAWGDDGEECLFSFLEPLLLITMEYAEGSEEWEKKWLALTEETPKILEARKLFGKKEISEYIKPVLFKPVSEIKNLPVCDVWREVLKKLKEIVLPPDLAFIKRCLEVGLKKVEGKAAVMEFLELASIYSDLWLSERKPEGLERIVARFWSAASQLDLEKKLSCK